MPYKALGECAIVTAGSGEKDWNNHQISTWIAEASGKFERSLSDETTHLVVTKKLWATGGAIVQEALRRKNEGQHIHIVSFDWLEDCLTGKSRKKEKNYKFSDPGLSFSGSGQDGGPRSHTGLLKELYLENTELTPIQQKANERKQAMEEIAAREKAAEKQAELQKHLKKSHSLSELGLIFKKGAKKARTILLDENYHIYQDHTGFHYDITLTKVDTAHNTNERYNLVIQIFESNIEPHKYAFSTTFSGTKIAHVNHVIVGAGSNFPTAMRAFRNCFREKTGVDWDQRLTAAKDRSQREKESRQHRSMGEYARDQLGVAKAKTVEDIRTQKFQYYPPSYGAVGQIGLSETEPGEWIAPDAHVVNHATDTSVRAIFGPEDVDKLNEAQLNVDELDEALDPVAPPFDFGESTDFEDAIAATSQGEAGLGDDLQEDGATQYMDLNSCAPMHGGESSQQTTATPSTAGSQAVLGKRKDSGTASPDAVGKRQKLDPDAGEYTAETDARTEGKETAKGDEAGYDKGAEADGEAAKVETKGEAGEEGEAGSG